MIAQPCGATAPLTSAGSASSTSAPAASAKGFPVRLRARVSESSPCRARDRTTRRAFSTCSVETTASTSQGWRRRSPIARR